MASDKITVTVGVGIGPYVVQNCHTGEFWHADRGEAMLYCTGDLILYYNVYRSGGSVQPLTVADLVKPRRPEAS